MLYLLRNIPDQFFIGQPATRYGFNRLNKAICILTLACVEPERLLIKITEQVKRFDAHIRSLNRTFQETPEVLYAVRVNLTVNVLLRMVNYLMDIFSIKAVISS